jgi:ABC-type nickel/cobalt efflux system permease component RcnA
VIPSPSALLLLLAAVALGRPWFGAALVGAFGVGMAITLCSVGLLAADVLARVSAWVPRTRSRWARLTRLTVAYGGAAGVCAVGAGLMLRSVLLV